MYSIKMDEIVTLLVMNLIAIQGELIVNPFIDDTTSSIIICNGDENNQLVREALEVSNVENIWISQWNCYDGPIPKASNSLIILIEIEPQDFKDILAREGIQRSLTTNNWIVYSNQKTLQVREYFDQRKLRLSPSARIFFVKPSFYPGHDAIQVQGTGSYEVTQKVLTNQRNIISQYL